MSLEKSLLERCLKRTNTYSGKPHTQHSLSQLCCLDISMYGPDSRTSVQIKGVKGHGLKKHRRLLPYVPLGKVKYSCSNGFIDVEFPSVKLLDALGGQHTTFHPLISYYMEKLNYPSNFSVSLAEKFANDHLDVEIDLDVIEAIIQYNSRSLFDNGHMVIRGLLEVEHEAKKRRWRTLDLSKWASAGLAYPLILPAKVQRPLPKEKSIPCYLSERHAKLLRMFDAADENGKKSIESAAGLTNQPTARAA